MVRHLLLGLVILTNGSVFAQDSDLRVELKSSLGSNVNCEGNAISARVVSPTGTSVAQSNPTAQSAPPAAGASTQPNLTAVKADFVPGEKTLFYDDFTDMAGDEPPPHWKVKGKAELRVGEGIRQLTMTDSSVELVPNLKGLPKNFTMEADLVFENVGSSYATWCFLKADRYKAMCLKLSALRVDGDVTAEAVIGDPRDRAEVAGKASVKVDFKQPVRHAVWVQNGRLRIYINGERLVDANQIDLDKVDSVRFVLGLDDTPNTAIGLRMVRFAETTPDFSSVISSSGRYVSHGILFDTDSDRIQPESAPVIKMIARACETNPNLKLLIEGHTDSVGSADHNLDLSRRRAEAVKAVLVSQFNVDSSRLTTAGLGSTKPIESNDTPQGRSQNRRVEFVRQ